MELGSAFLAADLEIATEVRVDHAADTGSWLEALKGEKARDLYRRLARTARGGFPAWLAAKRAGRGTGVCRLTAAPGGGFRRHVLHLIPSQAPSRSVGTK